MFKIRKTNLFLCFVHNNNGGEIMENQSSFKMRKINKIIDIKLNEENSDLKKKEKEKKADCDNKFKT